MMTSELQDMCARWWARRLKIIEKRVVFKNALVPLINSDDMTLSVDYDPQGALLNAVRAAGIECSGRMFSGKGILPLKTVMKIRGDVVSVKEGYGAPYVRLMPTDE